MYVSLDVYLFICIYVCVFEQNCMIKFKNGFFFTYPPLFKVKIRSISFISLLCIHIYLFDIRTQFKMASFYMLKCKDLKAF